MQDLWMWMRSAYLRQLDTEESLLRDLEIQREAHDHSNLDSYTIAEAMKSLVESNPFIKVKSIIAEVQARLNYTISYRKQGLVGKAEENSQSFQWMKRILPNFKIKKLQYIQ
ncbi:hypothetical protein Ahy_B07g088075 [Arachis hypogaea]|uniref:Uncharacterized protein n=1 Tax=Arachis hypogaea TaxID=3818 RepID=A0A444YDL9_ARAHY|nr:hypothetical protein Ahy_B07g088075 [Arachis hypogaea]